MAMTGLISAITAIRGPIIITITTASSSGATTVAMLNRVGGGGSWCAGGTTGSGCGGRPGRGGRLKGAVPRGGEVVQAARGRGE